MSVMFAYRPPTIVYRIGETNTFHAILLAAFTLSLVPVCYAMLRATPGGCGPFFGLNNMFGVVPETIDSFPNGLQTVLNFLPTAGFAVPALLLLSIVAYILRFQARAKQGVIEELKYWLQLERMDTRALLRNRAITT